MSPVFDPYQNGWDDYMAGEYVLPIILSQVDLYISGWTAARDSNE